MAKPSKTGKAKELEKKTRRHGLFPQAKEESSKKKEYKGQKANQRGNY